MKRYLCSGCGASYEARPARCPLCGHGDDVAGREASPPDVDSYQSNLRHLREQLRRLREDDAEAV